MRSLRLISLALALVLALSCSQREGRIIPRATLAKIYADMLVADQWLGDNYDERPVADTCLFYEPIFAKYGYTSADYRASIKRYIANPEKFKKVIEQASVEIMKDIDRIKAEKEAALEAKKAGEDEGFQPKEGEME